MKKIDIRSVDGQLLSTFLLVLEESSVTRAAERLGVTQSSVSHSLGRLRSVFDDPLFVRSGQSLLPTERAISLREPVHAVLDGLEGLTHQRNFDPFNDDLFFIVAANDTQRELIFPTLL
jgi:DNA-binding transcriptional LysR family regulator